MPGKPRASPSSYSDLPEAANPNRVEPVPASMHHLGMPSQISAPIMPVTLRQRAAAVLDEARGAACLCLVLATCLSLAGLGDTGWQWASLTGVPVWLGLRSARLV
jgi:hypothetical protein